MILERWFGTGDRDYENRLGKLERTLLRCAGSLHGPTTRALAKAAALSAQEMNHWLFLNDHSLFLTERRRLSPEDGAKTILDWFAFCLVILLDDDSLPDPEEGGREALEELIVRLFPVPGALVLREMEGLLCRLAGSRELFDQLLQRLTARMGTEADLERRITFGILLNQMLEANLRRARHFIP